IFFAAVLANRTSSVTGDTTHTGVLSISSAANPESDIGQSQLSARHVPEIHDGAARVGFSETYSTSSDRAGFFCDIRVKFVLIIPAGTVLFSADVSALKKAHFSIR
ncbi:MAG: hypothetical protein E7A34_02625, partial [Leclercia adecarboxylata]|nr:hypothetical protein [Leclercia adecarboxylata]